MSYPEHERDPSKRTREPDGWTPKPCACGSHSFVDLGLPSCLTSTSTVCSDRQMIEQLRCEGCGATPEAAPVTFKSQVLLDFEAREAAMKGET